MSRRAEANLCLLVAMLLTAVFAGGCTPRNQNGVLHLVIEESPTLRLESADGESSMNITDSGTISYITKNVTNAVYEKMADAGEAGSRGYRLSWYSGAGTLNRELWVVDEHTILFENQLYTIRSGIEKLDTDYLATLLKDVLNVVSAMRIVGPEDFTNPGQYGNVTADQLAKALNQAAKSRVEAKPPTLPSPFSGNLHDYWVIDNAYLEGGPSSHSSEDLHFCLACGLAENLVEVSLCKGSNKDKAFFLDETLYRLVRHCRDYEEIVDSALYNCFKDLLVAKMEEILALMSKNPAHFTGYELTRFAEAWGYDEEALGSRVGLYHFNFALLTDDPSTVGWAGGMYLDSRLRVQGLDIGQLAVRYKNEEVVSSVFMGHDSYYEGGSPDDEEWFRELISTALDRAGSSLP